jgi:hypothetical protein
VWHAVVVYVVETPRRSESVLRSITQYCAVQFGAGGAGECPEG